MAAEPLGVWSTDGGLEAVPTAPPTVTSVQFEALYRQHFDRLRRFCLGMTGQTSLAEDIAQETLLRAYVRMERLDFDRPLWPWLKKVATRLVYDHARAGREVCAEPEDQAIDDETDRYADRDLVHRVLRRLPERQRTAVALRYLENWKPAEVAELLDLERPAVEQLLLRARRSLCAEYRRLGGDRLRIALWPLLALLSRIRDRAVRVATTVGELSASGVAMAADTVSILVVATALTLSAGAGVAHASVLDHPTPAPAPEVQRAPRSVAARGAVPDVPARSPATSRALAAFTAARSDTPRHAAPRQSVAASSTPQPAPATRSVKVVAPTTAAPAGTPKAAAQVEKSAEKATLRGHVEAAVTGAPVGVTEAAPTWEVECDSEVRQAACDAAAATVETVNEGPPTAP